MNEPNAPTPMDEANLIKFMQAATTAASRIFGRGTSVHTPESVAADKVAQVLEKGSLPRSVTSYGHHSGANGAADCLRRQYVEQKYIEFAKSERTEQCTSDAITTLAKTEETDLVRDALFAMKPSEFVYPLVCDALGLPLTLVARVVNQANRSELALNTHAARRKSARLKMKSLLEKLRLEE